MSGCSYESKCPNCNKEVNTCEDNKPFQMTYIGPCFHCGFTTITKVVYEDLDAINSLRFEYNDDNGYEKGNLDYLEPLTELPKQTKNFYWNMFNYILK